MQHNLLANKKPIKAAIVVTAEYISGILHTRITAMLMKLQLRFSTPFYISATILVGKKSENKLDMVNIPAGNKMTCHLKSNHASILFSAKTIIMTSIMLQTISKWHILISPHC
jgi:hypothetical protein